jgi:pimeloyl-ACP methyl ester carboxylesterase
MPEDPSMIRRDVMQCVSMSIRCLLAYAVLLVAEPLYAQDLPELTEIKLKSTMDGETQPVLYWAPRGAKRSDTPSKKTPMMVFLHSWSSDYLQNNSKWYKPTVARGWIFLHPNFRGANQTPKACGSKFARQDILDSIDWAVKNLNVDEERLYLAGSSGGGHISMLMAGHHPDRFSAVSSWVGISNLAEWYRFHARKQKPSKYARMISDSLGGPPGESKARDAEYKDRSPIYHIHQVGDLPIEICSGVKDGITGSVPIMHTLDAFNMILKGHGNTQIPEKDISYLWTNGRLLEPTKSDKVNDSAWSRPILLRRYSKKARVTIFQGGHESLPDAAFNWLERHRRKTKQTKEPQANLGR